MNAAALACPHCRAQLVEGARFCPACGQATVPTATQAPRTAEPADPIIGREIGGRYRILAKLGEGGMGAVYRGEQISLKRTVAVKLLRPEVSSNEMIVRRFNAEAEAVAKLNHPNTVNIYDFGRDGDGTLFIAMEFVEGRSLRTAIHREGPLPPARALAIAAQIAASLTDAHAHSIVHRDLKPDNVMLQDRGRQRDVVRVLDFGIAKLRDDQRATQQAMTQAGDMLGTPQYMAPEQIRGEAIDGRTDIYALGCMLYEMVTARMPFEAPSIMAMLSKHLLEHAPPPSQRRPELGIPPAIDQLIMAALAKDAAARPPTMEAYGEHIAAVLAMLPPDPQRAASMPHSAVQSVPSPQLTPAAYSAQGAPQPYPTPQPPSYAPPPRVPTPGPQHAPTYSTRKSRAPLYAILAILVLGGGGAGIFFATRNNTPATNGSGSSSGSNTVAEPEPEPESEPDRPTPTPTPTPVPDVPAKVDTWGAAAPDPWGNAAPTTNDGETVESEKGFGLIVPAGWAHEVTDDGTIAAASDASSDAVAIVVGEPPAGDITSIVKHYSAAQHMPYVMGKMHVRGKDRVRATFTKTVGGKEFIEVAVLFDDQSPRVFAVVHAPKAKLSDTEFVLWLQAVFERRVILP